MKKGLAPILIILTLIPIVGLLAWSPWITENFAKQQVLSTIKPPCEEFKTPEVVYDFKTIFPADVQRFNLRELFGFGKQIKIVVNCSPLAQFSTIETYFVSLIGTVHKLSSHEYTPPQATKKDETVYPDSIGANWKTYENKNLGFLVKYPNKVVLGEVKKGENTMIVFNNYSELGIQPNIDSRPGNELENKSIYIDISVDPVSENTTLETYLDQKYPDKGGNNSGIPSFQNQKIEMKNILIGGEKGLLKETGMEFENISRKAWVKKENKVFIFSAYGSGETGTYVSDDAVETFDQILSTFKFTN